LGLPVTFVESAGKRNGDAKTQAIEIDVVIVALGDPHGDQSLTISVCRFGIEVARASECTGTILYPFAFEAPISHCHQTLLDIGVALLSLGLPQSRIEGQA
jgi:hypothetical protein